MKKFIKSLAVVLSFVMILTIISPVSDVQAATQKTYERNAQKYLNAASNDCKKIMNTIYNSWYFHIYKVDDCISYIDDNNDFHMEILKPYCNYTGIPESEVKKIIKEFYGTDDIEDDDIYGYLSVLDCSIDIVTTYYSRNGTYKKISNNLNKAKKNIKKMSNKKSKKKLLQNYYNAVNKYYKFVSNPSGSFSELNGKRDSLNEKVDDCKEELSW